jgi:hypothetical protein
MTCPKCKSDKVERCREKNQAGVALRYWWRCLVCGECFGDE